MIDWYFKQVDRKPRTMADVSLDIDDQEWYTMVIPLKFTWQPTQDELVYLRELVCLRMEQRKSISIQQHDCIRPSTIIDRFLYHGDLKHAMNKTLLEELDIRCIINVSDYQLKQDIVDQRHVLWINVEDDTYTDIAQHFAMTNEFLRSCRAKDKNVLVHCQMGVSRSSSIVLAYLMKYHHGSLNEAYDYLIQRRSCAKPNLGFLLQLVRYERELHKTNEAAQGQAIAEKENLIAIPSTSPASEPTNTKMTQSKTKRQRSVLLRWTATFRSLCRSCHKL